MSQPIWKHAVVGRKESRRIPCHCRSVSTEFGLIIDAERSHIIEYLVYYSVSVFLLEIQCMDYFHSL